MRKIALCLIVLTSPAMGQTCEDRLLCIEAAQADLDLALDAYYDALEVCPGSPPPPPPPPPPPGELDPANFFPQVLSYRPVTPFDVIDGRVRDIYDEGTHLPPWSELNGPPFQTIWQPSFGQRALPGVEHWEVASAFTNMEIPLGANLICPDSGCSAVFVLRLESLVADGAFAGDTFGDHSWILRQSGTAGIDVGGTELTVPIEGLATPGWLFFSMRRDGAETCLAASVGSVPATETCLAAFVIPQRVMVLFGGSGAGPTFDGGIRAVMVAAEKLSQDDLQSVMAWYYNRLP